uniref:Uncharacterized protein n=1 Tax=Glossina morsitans morsitans TaxID=37546 RepID=A0A1B0G3N2_GLOMM
MKLLYFVLMTLPLLAYPYPSSDDDKSLEDVNVDNDEAASAQDAHLQKRSGGSTDYLVHLKGGLLSSLGHASAAVASSSSGASSGGGYSYKPHGDGHHINSIEYDPWSLKKSVLNTILTAVKAITGGVTALKGQLIKSSGYALSASGHIAAASGDKITDVGKIIINSAASKVHPAPSGGGGQHPFAKISSLSGASSAGSSGSKHPSGGHVVHTDTITSYEIPSGGHGSYGPPPKPQYLAPSGGGVGAGFSHGGHVAFEAPSSNYLPSSYGLNGQDDFNIYGRHKKLSDEEARKAAAQLQEILSLLPITKTELTASKTIDYSTGPLNNADSHTYALSTNHLGNLESLSHIESITAAYAPARHEVIYKSPSDIYHQMHKQKRTPEDIYIEKHPNEKYEYNSIKNEENFDNDYKYVNYHALPVTEKTDVGKTGASNVPLKDLTTLIAALQAVKRDESVKPASVSYALETSVHKAPPTGPALSYATPIVKKTKYIFYPPTPSKPDYYTIYKSPSDRRRGSYKTRRQVPSSEQNARRKRMASKYKSYDYDSQDSLLFTRLLGDFY